MKILWLRVAARLAWALATAACSWILLTPAQAAGLTPADEKSVLAVVQSQLAALAQDDAAKAFSFAAPNVREAVGSATQFLAMIRRSYPAIYRPASTAFLKPEGHDDSAIQRVQMEDADGHAWVATYSVHRQKNKVWRITGCQLVPTKGRMA
ncbi:MAG: DUF4864 domain-containing protein [Polaromonas sp.]